MVTIILFTGIFDKPGHAALVLSHHESSNPGSRHSIDQSSVLTDRAAAGRDRQQTQLLCAGVNDFHCFKSRYKSRANKAGRSCVLVACPH
jgi:hypothetical protein